MRAAYAHTNIALVKYWGKRDAALNLPATGSLSLTLDRFGTHTEVELCDGPEDTFHLEGEPASAREQARVSRFLDLVRAEAGRTERCAVRSRNDVPTAAGLASSASAFAALAVAAAAAFDLDADGRALSILARRGSGSAARSLFGGFVRMNRGELDDGSDAFAEPVPVHPALDVRLLVVRCAAGRKAVGSTEGMDRTAATSPLYPPWVATHAQDLADAERALADGDLASLGAVMEHSTLKMHASALGARPGLWYFGPTTVAVMNRVRELAADGAQAWFTMDAGPHVKVLCPQRAAEALRDELARVEGVLGVEVAGPGPAARVLDEGER